jgi:phosphate/sulfate permease
LFFWWSVFVTPFAASTIEWVILGSRRRDQLHHVTVVLAMLLTTMAALLGIWTLIHFPGMLLMPASTGHKVVFAGCLLATLGGFAAVTWVVIERHWLSWMALAISGWMFAVWMLMLLESD